ncbi:unnamed protein product, partial [Rotaria sordida]
MVQMAASHACYPIEEDYEILRHAGYFPTFTHISGNEDCNPESWICNEISKDYAYDYHEIFLRMLNSVDMPQSHWLLKSPLHIFCLDKFLQIYPNALLIMTHRNLDEVLPSLCSLSLSGTEFYDNLMKDPIGVVHQIYDYFNLQWSNEFEMAIHNWLLKNPQ